MPHVETRIDGVWFPSVTTITGAQEKPWLKAWREKWGILALRKTNIATAVGTAFHDCVEQFLDTGTYAVHMDTYASCVPRVDAMMKSWVTWAASVDGVIEETELKVVSRQYTYSGTLDAIGTFEGLPMIVDWKTSSRIYPDMDLQLVAYSQAYKEERGKTIKHGLIVHVSKDKPKHKVTIKVFTLGRRVLNEFLKLRDAFDEIKFKSAGSENE